MPKKEELVDLVDEVVEAPVAPKGEDSPAKKEFAKLIEAYKVQNPAKYELKKEELEKQLNLL